MRFALRARENKTAGHWLPSLTAMLLLSGCTVGTEYEVPKADTKPEWSALEKTPTPLLPPDLQTPEPPSAVRIAAPAEGKDLGWWKQFSDESLTALTAKTVENNNDLKIAESRLAEAQASQHGAYAAFFPQVDAAASVGRGKFGSASGQTLDTISQAAIVGAWDVDVFGGNQRRHEAAEAGTQAALAEFESVRLALLAEVATNYVRLRGLQKQHDIIVKNLDMQHDTLAITKRQRQEGVISDMEVVRAQAQVNSTEARLPPIEAAIMAVINRLSVLTALKTNDIKTLTATPAPIPTVAKEVVVTTPVDTIAHRPDVRAAERRLAQAAALSNAAFTQFFPKLSLEGFFGGENSDHFGSASPWGAAINGLVPLLNFGSISAQVDAANARQQQAFFGYKETMLLALEETETALSNYIHELKRRETLALAAGEQVKATQMARQQYEAGVTTQLDLLVAEQNQLIAENDLVLSESAVAENLISLYRALGEGWDQASASVVQIPQKNQQGD